MKPPIGQAIEYTKPQGVQVECLHKTTHGQGILNDKEACAEIVNLYSEGLSSRTIAKQLGKSHSTVWQALNQARKDGTIPELRSRILETVSETLMDTIKSFETLREDFMALDPLLRRADYLTALASYSKATWIGVGITVDKQASQTATVQISAGPGSVIQLVNDYSQKLTQFTPEPPPVVVQDTPVEAVSVSDCKTSEASEGSKPCENKSAS